jgi:hypothetical protein
MHIVVNPLRSDVEGTIVKEGGNEDEKKEKIEIKGVSSEMVYMCLRF